MQPETSTDGTGAGEGQENDAIIGEDLNGDTSESTTGAAGKDGETGSDIAGGTTEEGQDGITAAGADGTGGGLIGGAAQGESDGTLATGATGDGIGGAASNEMASEGSQTEGQAQASNSDGMQAAPLEGGAVSDEALQADASTKDENAETVAGGTAPEVESEASDGTEDTSEVAVTVPTENGFDDELIIAYDADSKGYAVYSAQDLLTENEEKLVSVDKKMDEYLQNGGELTGTAPQVKSLEVNRSQKNGIVIMLVIGVAIAGMLTILAVQKYSRRRR